MRLVYSLLYPMGLALAALASPFNTKLRLGLRGRLGSLRRVRAWAGTLSERPYWFHVASSGELEQCLPILEAIRSQRPGQPLFLSYFSPSAKTALELERKRRQGRAEPPPWDYSDYNPFDFAWTASRFVLALRPKAFIAIHREIWPGVVSACLDRSVPCHLFASYFPPRARRWGWLYRPWLKEFRSIGTTESTTQDFLKKLLPEVAVTFTGDPRVERVLSRRKQQKESGWASYFDGQSAAILASLWREDFLRIRGPICNLALRFPRWRWLVVPHEPEERFVKDLLEWFSAQGLPALPWSEWVRKPDLRSHLIIDEVGLLAELYRLGKMVFVGGSFRSRVHNVLEPAAYGLPILTGPFIDNSAEACEMEGRGLIRVRDDREFFETARALMSDAEEQQTLSKQVSDYLYERQGAAQRCVELLFADRAGTPGSFHQNL